MYTLGLDTIAGAKLLQLKFGSFGAFQPDQAVIHGADAPGSSASATAQRLSDTVTAPTPSRSRSTLSPSQPKSRATLRRLAARGLSALGFGQPLGLK
jgi:hypothetical protein